MKYFLQFILALTLFSNSKYAQGQCEPIAIDGSSLWYITQYKIGSDPEVADFSGFNDPDYHDLTNQIHTVMDGSAFNMEVTSGYDGNLAVWIDLNDDDIFSSNEKKFEAFVTGDLKNSFKVNLTGGDVGLRKIRIRLIDGYSALTVDPCASVDNGMTIDLSLDIEAYRDRAPDADFTTNNDIITTYVGGFIIFKDNSLYKPTNWSWEFEGGYPATSTKQNPYVRYDAPGCYAVTMTSSNALGSSSTSKTCYITVEEYCTPEDESGPWSEDYYMHGTALGSILNEQENTSYDQDYTYYNGSNTNLEINESYDITIKTKSDIVIAAWIDYDQDNKFEDSEKLFEFESPSTETDNVQSFTVPDNAVAGKTRMRILNSWLDSDLDPCETYNYGEVEDYNVTIVLKTPEADFEASTTSISTEDSIDFTDLSVNQVTSWNWTFEGGTPASSTEKHPKNIKFPTVGTWQVSLTATNGLGNDVETKSGYIEVSYVPSAQFTADRTNITPGESVNFTDESDNRPTSYQWFVDGTFFSDEQNPTNIHFNSPGRYTIALQVEGDFGTKLYREKTNYINAQYPAGMEDIKEINPISIFPNPNNGSFALVFKALEMDNYSIDVIDIQGKSVYNTQIENTFGDYSQRIELDKVEKGIYFVNLTGTEKSFTQKLIIH